MHDCTDASPVYWLRIKFRPNHIIKVDFDQASR